MPIETRVAEILLSAGQQGSRFAPPSSTTKVGCCGSFSTGSPVVPCHRTPCSFSRERGGARRRYSTRSFSLVFEAIVSPKPGRMPMASSATVHAVGSSGRGDLVLDPEAAQFVVAEAKLYSPLSAGTKKRSCLRPGGAERGLYCRGSVPSTASPRGPEPARLLPRRSSGANRKRPSSALSSRLRACARRFRTASDPMRAPRIVGIRSGSNPRSRRHTSKRSLGKLSFPPPNRNTKRSTRSVSSSTAPCWPVIHQRHELSGLSNNPLQRPRDSRCSLRPRAWARRPVRRLGGRSDGGMVYTRLELCDALDLG